jgi:hypothetical protein
VLHLVHLGAQESPPPDLARRDLDARRLRHDLVQHLRTSTHSARLRPA